MLNRIFLIFLIFLIDLAIFYYAYENHFPKGNHSGIYTALIMQLIVLIDILFDFRISLFFLHSIGLLQKNAHYVLLFILIIPSWLELYKGIIGTYAQGAICHIGAC